VQSVVPLRRITP